MRGVGLCLCPRILTVSVLMSAGSIGCGDPPLCQSDVVVAVDQTLIASDVDAAVPGVQTDIRIRSSLQEGDVITLEVLGVDGTSFGSVAAPAAADGSVVFAGVSVPVPRVVLRATGRGTCGEGRDEITVDVFAGAACLLQVTPDPEVNAYYAPLGVLSRKTDPDPVTPGYQAFLRVVTRAGFRAEIFEITAGEQSLGNITAGPDGFATLPVTVLDGQVGFRAICRGAGGELASQTLTLFADTTPPACGLVAPTPGTTITVAQDENHDLGDGVQLAITAHAAGGDVAGEPVTLAVSALDGSTVMVPASDADASGTSTASTTLAPAVTPTTFDFTLTMRDHAGNACTVGQLYDVVYNGCAIA